MTVVAFPGNPWPRVRSRIPATIVILPTISVYRSEDNEQRELIGQLIDHGIIDEPPIFVGIDPGSPDQAVEFQVEKLADGTYRVKSFKVLPSCS